MKNWRIFWIAELDLYADGNYHWFWKNWLTGENHQVFAGYNRHAVIRQSSAWATVKEQIA